MKNRSILTLLLSTTLLISSLSPALAKDCKIEEDALSVAQSAIVGATAAVSSAKSAVAAAKSQLRKALLPAQRAGATVNVYKSEKDLSTAVKALTAAKVTMKTAKSALTSCKS